MRKFWLKEYPPGISPELAPLKYDSLIDMFEKVVKRQPDHPAYINMGKVLTFRTLEEKSRHLAAYFQNTLKLNKGDRVAIMLPNLLQYPISFFAAIRAGLIVVNVNPLYTAYELEKQLIDSGAKAIIVADNFAATLEKVVSKTPLEHIIITKIGDQLSFYKKIMINFVMKYAMRYIPKYKIAYAVSYHDAIKQGELSQYIRPTTQLDEVVLFQYTGGTTGIAKGTMITHKNLLSNIAQTIEWVSPVVPKLHKDYAISPLPLYHAFSLMISGLLMFELGLKNVLITNPKNMKVFVKELKKYPFSVIIGVNTLYNALLQNEAFHKLDFSALQLTISGGMPVDGKVADTWQQLTGIPIIEGYGMTECSPLIAAAPYNITKHENNIGFPVPSTDLKILDDDGNEVEFGQPGELWVKGPQVMLGYWNNPEATKNTMKDGWIGTGDIFIVTKENRLKLIDRKKELIIVSGFNVYPAEVEAVLNNNPKILESAAIGIPDPIVGEKIKIFVVKKDASLTREELRNYCRQYLTGYKIPKFIEFRDELPKSNIGKILRYELRQEEIQRQAQGNPPSNT